MASYMLIVVLMVSILSIIFYQRFNQKIEEQISGANLERLHQIRVMNERMREDVETIALWIINDYDGMYGGGMVSFNKIDLEGITVSNLNEPENILKIWEFRSKLQGIVQIYESIHSIYFYNGEERIIVGSLDSNPDIDKFYDRDWIDAYESMDGASKWMSVRYSVDEESKNNLTGDVVSGYSPADIITYIKKNPQYSVPFQGAVIINLKESEVSSCLVDSLANAKEHIYIYDENDVILASSQPEMIYTKLSDKIVNSIGSSTENYFYTTNGEEKYINYCIETDYGLGYILQKPYLDIQNLTLTMSRFIIYLSVALAAIGILIALFASKMIYNPIKMVISKIKETGVWENQGNEFAVINHVLDSSIAESRELKTFVDNNLMAIQQTYLQSIFSGQLYEDDAAERKIKFLSQYFKRNSFAVMMIVISLEEPKNSDTESMSIVQTMFLRICNSIDHDKFRCSAMPMDMNKIILAVNKESDMNIKECGRIILSHLAHQGITVNMLAGREYTNIAGLRNSYTETISILNRRVINKNHKFICFDDMRDADGLKKGYPVDLDEKLVYYIRKSNLVKVRELFEEFLTELFEKGTADKAQIENYCIRLISSIYRTLETIGRIPQEADCFNNPYKEFLKSDYTVEKIRRWFYSFFELVCRDSADINKDYFKYKVQIEKYMDENYNREISLNSLANEINVSYSYMRKIYKQIFGYNFVYYLNFIRVEKAKTLLLESNLKVRDISSRVGYNNEQSFYRNFKKMTNLTPEEYRIQHNM